MIFMILRLLNIPLDRERMVGPACPWGLDLPFSPFLSA